MNAPTETRVDVLAVLRRHAGSHRAMSSFDAYSEQEAPRLEASIVAVSELIDTMDMIAHQCGPYAERSPALDYATIANLARAALARIGGAE